MPITNYDLTGKLKIYNHSQLKQKCGSHSLLRQWLPCKLRSLFRCQSQCFSQSKNVISLSTDSLSTMMISLLMNKTDSCLLT